MIVTSNTLVDPIETGDRALLSTFGTYNTASFKNILDALQCNFKCDKWQLKKFKVLQYYVYQNIFNLNR